MGREESYGVGRLYLCSLCACERDRQADRQTDRNTETEGERQNSNSKT